jgi:hypothetical protein
MGRRVTDGPGDELRRQHEDLRRRTDWEDPAGSMPDPDWESPDKESTPPPRDPLQELQALVGTALRRGLGRPARR